MGEVSYITNAVQEIAHREPVPLLRELAQMEDPQVSLQHLRLSAPRDSTSSRELCCLSSSKQRLRNTTRWLNELWRQSSLDHRGTKPNSLPYERSSNNPTTPRDILSQPWRQKGKRAYKSGKGGSVFQVR